MAELSIGQLSARADVNPSTLRYDESVSLLPSPERKNGQRRYDERLLDRINFIKVAQQTGFSIQEIAVLLEGFETDDSLSERCLLDSLKLAGLYGLAVAAGIEAPLLWYCREHRPHFVRHHSNAAAKTPIVWASLRGLWRHLCYSRCFMGMARR